VTNNISPASNLYCVEFEFERRLGASLILPATCEMAARLRALTLFPEYKRNATGVSVFPVKYVELNWQTGRCLVIKQSKRPAVSFSKADAIGAPHNRKELPRLEEEGGVQ
jgi:hypothetical protein